MVKVNSTSLNIRRHLIFCWISWGERLSVRRCQGENRREEGEEWAWREIIIILLALSRSRLANV